MVAVLAVVSLWAGCAPPSPAGGPIGPRETFTGLVNGQPDKVQVLTACGGPGTVGRLGYAVSGQTVSVVKDPLGAGFTGDNGTLFVEPNGSSQVVHLTTYDTTSPFPTDVKVPCDGPGRVVFDPCFGFVGCQGGAHADVVQVVFVNIAR